MHDNARARRASLAGGAEGAPYHALERQPEVCVIHDYDCVLAAHLETDALRAGLACYRGTGIAVSREADCADALVAHERHAGGSSRACDEVYDAWRDACLREQL